MFKAEKFYLIKVLNMRYIRDKMYLWYNEHIKDKRANDFRILIKLTN